MGLNKNKNILNEFHLLLFTFFYRSYYLKSLTLNISIGQNCSRVVGHGLISSAPWIPCPQGRGATGRGPEQDPPKAGPVWRTPVLTPIQRAPLSEHSWRTREGRALSSPRGRLQGGAWPGAESRDAFPVIHCGSSTWCWRLPGHC